MEVACTDEVKVYKDEGEEEEQKKSSENLTEDKVGLVTEGEVQYSPKNAFNLGFFSLGDYYHSLFPLSFTRGASPYAVAAAAAAAAHRVHLSSPESIFCASESQHDVTLQRSACVRSPPSLSSKQRIKASEDGKSTHSSSPPTCRSGVRSIADGSDLVNSQRSVEVPPQQPQTHAFNRASPLLPCLEGLHPSWGALMSSPLYDAAVHAAAATVAIGSPGPGAPFWPATMESQSRGATQLKQFPNPDSLQAKSSPSVVAVAAAAAAALSQSPSPTTAASFHSELLMAANLYGLKTAGSHKRSGSLLGTDSPVFSSGSPFAPSTFESPNSPTVPFLENLTGLALNPSATKDTKSKECKLERSPSSLAVSAPSMCRGRVKNSPPFPESSGFSATRFDSTNSSTKFSPCTFATDLSVPSSESQPKDFSVGSPSRSVLSPENGLDFSFADSGMLSGSSRSFDVPACPSVLVEPSTTNPVTSSSKQSTALNSSSPVTVPHTDQLDRSSVPVSVYTSVALSTSAGTTVSCKRAHIKKPLNAFMLFMKDMRPRVQEECTLKESAAINQILGRKWHELSREKQAKYYELARKEKELHHQLFPGWSARDNYAMHSRRKKKRRLAALVAAQSTPNRQSNANSSDPTSIGEWASGQKPTDVALRCTSSSSSINMVDIGSAKKCRARFGLEHQHRWCKPCRRKKKCIRFMTDSEFEETERQLSNPSSSPARTSSVHVPVSTLPISNLQCSVHQSPTSGMSPPHPFRKLGLWSSYMPNLPGCRIKRSPPVVSCDAVPPADTKAFSIHGASLPHFNLAHSANSSSSIDIVKSTSSALAHDQTSTTPRVAALLEAGVPFSPTQRKSPLKTNHTTIDFHAFLSATLSGSTASAAISRAPSSTNSASISGVTRCTGSSLLFGFGNHN
ncbi:unnamed protein product [Dicrocoelium dendriticum]|nr:unnamed protein product [Dicrocoelium dendriticum]CAH8643484.1 unnamed protein product [Dicrocoelium dendriticum]